MTAEHDDADRPMMYWRTCSAPTNSRVPATSSGAKNSFPN
jgi:hypothetical protein